VLNATFSNIEAISWRPVLVVKEAWNTRKDSPTMERHMVNFITIRVFKASFTTKNGRNDIASILLKVALSKIKSKSTQLLANQN
jgi:hypothetical protein